MWKITKKKPVGGDCKTVKRIMKKIMRVTREIGQKTNRRNELKKKQLETPVENLKLETNGSDNNAVTIDKETHRTKRE